MSGRMTERNAPSIRSDAISAVRHFNRFYTREVGLLRRTFLDTPWTLGEVRVLYEIWMAPGILAKTIADRLDLDRAYLSRMLSRFERQGDIRRTACADDGRQQLLFLTDAGEARILAANEKQRSATERAVKDLNEAELGELMSAMQTIETLLSRKNGERA